MSNGTSVIELNWPWRLYPSCRPFQVQSIEHLCSILPDFNWQRARVVPQRQLGFLYALQTCPLADENAQDKLLPKKRLWVFQRILATFYRCGEQKQNYLYQISLGFCTKNYQNLSTPDRVIQETLGGRFLKHSIHAMHIPMRPNNNNNTHLMAFFSSRTWVHWYQKDKPFWVLLNREMMG